MAGKSTFLRQNALIALLAQMGAFVPAKTAHIGVIEQLFSRVGAADDLARGRSTFMVEMVETAAILNQAGDRALVILDEIGRGTATYDGLSIAWATLEHLHDVNHCRTLFATHYHELSALTAKLSGLKNATVAVREWEGDVIFLHEVREGAADRSYGVQVGKLAGLPVAVVERAREVLSALEQSDRDGGGKAETLIDDLPLFSATPPPAPAKPSEIEDMLRDIHPDELTLVMHWHWFTNYAKNLTTNTPPEITHALKVFMPETTSIEIQMIDSIAAIPAADWDACANPANAPLDPFVTHRFLLALEESGSVGDGTGWAPRHLVAKLDSEIIGVMPLYAKGHSQGEYVFDHAWAGAYERAGGRYYPKLQSAVPFTPVTGRRILVRDDIVRGALMRAAIQITSQNQVSSFHITFCTKKEYDLGPELGMMQRIGQQFHWETAATKISMNFCRNFPAENAK